MKKYKPKPDHPWRQYKNKVRKSEQKEDDTSVRPLKGFIKDLARNWDNWKFSPRDYETSSFLKHKSNREAAKWLIGFLKRHYINPSYDR